MKSIRFTLVLLVLQCAAFGQQPVVIDTVAAQSKYVSFQRLLRTDTIASKTRLSPLRSPTPSAGRAHYTVQYRAYQQRQLSGFRDPQAANTYVPPPTPKPNILLRKKTKAPLKKSF